MEEMGTTVTDRATLLLRAEPGGREGGGAERGR